MDPPAEGCLLCSSTWGNWWEDVDGRSSFFCCEMCASQWKTIRDEVQRSAEWGEPPALELDGNRYGRTGVGRVRGASVRFSVAFTPEGALHRFAAEPVEAPAAPPAPTESRPSSKEALHPKLEERLVQEAESYPDLTSVPIDEARSLVREVAIELDGLAGGAPAVSQIRNSSYRAGDHRVAARVYTPTEGEAPFPVVAFFHGGAFAFGDLDTHDALARELANRSASVVVSVAYRRAPESKFPGALEDGYAALQWLVEPATVERFEIDPRRLAVAGDSAGATLAAGVATLALERNGPPVAAEVLIYPILDHRPATTSYTENASGFGLETSFLDWMWEQYLPSPEDASNPHAVPARRSELIGTPPTLVVTAGVDPVRDEGEAFAGRLRDAGVDVHLSRYSGMIHGFLDYRGLVDEGWVALDEIGAWLRRRFAAAAADPTPPLPPPPPPG